MPIVNNPTYGDPYIASASNSLGQMIFGNPDTLARNRYFNSEANNATANAAATAAKTKLLGQQFDARSGFAQAIAAAAAPHPEDANLPPNEQAMARASRVAGVMMPAGGDGSYSGASMKDLGQLFLGNQTAQNPEVGYSALAVSGKAPSKDASFSPAQSDANASRDAALAKDQATSVANIAQAGENARHADTVDAVSAKWLQEHPDSVSAKLFSPHNTGENDTTSYAPGDPRAPGGTVMGPRAAAASAVNASTATNDQRRLAGVEVKEGAEKAGSMRIALKPQDLVNVENNVGALLGYTGTNNVPDVNALKAQLTPQEQSEYADAVASGWGKQQDAAGAAAAGAQYLRSKFAIKPNLIFPGQSATRLESPAAPASAAPAVPAQGPTPLGQVFASPAAAAPAAAAPVPQAAPQAPAAAPVAGPPPLAARKVGMVVQGAKGPVQWTGTGWVPAR